jgi:glycosyltransferase involved in cell wall biosynthesis
MPTWKVNISRYCKRFIYKLCTHICPVSIAAQKDIANVYGVPIINISKLQKNRNFIVCVGRLDRCKGQDILIKSLSILKDRVSKLQVKFIGEGMLKDELQNMAYKFGISEQCIFTGALTHDEVLHQISESGITIVPSRSEAFGNVCIESLAVGTPVVASSVGGIPEIIRDGIDGYLVPPEDPKALANAIVNLLNMNDEEYRQMCLNARQRFLEKFEQNKVIKEQASWFESIVSGALRNE